MDRTIGRLSSAAFIALLFFSSAETAFAEGPPANAPAGYQSAVFPRAVLWHPLAIPTVAEPVLNNRATFRFDGFKPAPGREPQRATAAEIFRPAPYAIGHWAPSTYGVRDYFLGPEGVAIYIPTYIYHTTTFKDRNGDKVDQIQLADRTIDVDANVTMVLTVPTLVWTTPWHPFGKNSKFGMIFAPSFGNASISAQLQDVAGRGIASESGNYGWGDTLFQPVRLQWDWPKFSFSAGYLVFAPTGDYQTGAQDNIGLGFWSNLFQFAGEYRFGEHNLWSVIADTTYEINGNRTHEDFNVGDTFCVGYGITHYRPVNKGLGLLDFSLTGTNYWQVTDDTGADVGPTGSNDIHDRVSSIGGRFGYVFAKQQIVLAGNVLQEYGARARFQGTWYYFSLTKAFSFAKKPAHP